MKAGFEEYSARYADFAHMTREGGLLEIRLHTGGGHCVFDGPMHGALGDMFADVGYDQENRVIILTGTGDRFMMAEDMDMSQVERFLPHTPAVQLSSIPESIRLIENFLRIECPVISAINGPLTVHAEIPVLADVVLASDTACFADPFHFCNGVVPGDGVQVIWPMMIGLNRARYFLLTGERISAAEAKTIGFVNEVLPQADLLPRARAIAQRMLEKPNVTLRATRHLFSRALKRAISEDLPFGLAMEGIANINHFPTKLRYD